MLASKLKTLRHSNKWSQEYVAKMLEIPRSTYRDYEIGRTTPANYQIYLRISKLYFVSLKFILEDHDNYKLANTITTDNDAKDLFKNLSNIMLGKSSEEILELANVILEKIKSRQ